MQSKSWKWDAEKLFRRQQVRMDVRRRASDGKNRNIYTSIHSGPNLQYIIDAAVMVTRGTQTQDTDRLVR